MKFIKKLDNPALLFKVGMICLFIAACSKIDESVMESEWTAPDQQSWNAELTMTKDSIRNAKVYAGVMKQYNESGEVYISDSMRVDFYNDEGYHTSYLQSDSGIVNEKKQNLIAIGNVVFRSDTGYVMYTDKLFWFNDSNLVYTDGDIELFSDTDTLYGTGFRSDVRLENWTIDKPRGSTRREYEPVKPTVTE
jgi:LPS export ABC transporter protein LptC